VFNDSISAFRSAMAQAGLLPSESIQSDGTLHRFKVEGDKPGSINGFYVLHLDHRPAGCFGSWKTGAKHSWRADGRALTSVERESENDMIRNERLISLIERRTQHEIFAIATRSELDRSSAADPNHPYLLAKQVGPHNLRQFGKDLLVPLRDAFGIIWNLQAIDPSGVKRFRKGRAKGLFAVIGDLKDPSALTVCEGWATGASLSEFFNVPVLCAMSAGNLLSVGTSARLLWPNAEITIAADNDLKTAGNPGVTKALEARAAIDSKVVVAYFPPGVEGTDFNDRLNQVKREGAP